MKAVVKASLAAVAFSLCISGIASSGESTSFTRSSTAASTSTPATGHVPKAVPVNPLEEGIPAQSTAVTITDVVPAAAPEPAVAPSNLEVPAPVTPVEQAPVAAPDPAPAAPVSAPLQSTPPSPAVEAPAPVVEAAAAPIAEAVHSQATEVQTEAIPAACLNLQIGQAWMGVGATCQSSAPLPAPAPTNEEYAHLIRNIVAPWCPNINVLVDDPSVVSGNVYGMMWWGTNKMAIRSGIPMAITKDMALHECGHMLQARLYPNKWEAVHRMNAIYGHSDGIETNARCISAYLHPSAQPIGVGTGATARWHSAECAGAYGQAAIKVVQGVRP